MKKLTLLLSLFATLQSKGQDSIKASRSTLMSYGYTIDQFIYGGSYVVRDTSKCIMQVLVNYDKKIVEWVDGYIVNVKYTTGFSYDGQKKDYHFFIMKDGKTKINTVASYFIKP